MLRNNLTEKKNEIPSIQIKKFMNWSGSIEISIDKDFSYTNLFICIKSYSDSLIINPIQILIKVEDRGEKGRSFFSESISIHKMSKMSLTDFAGGYNNRWQKDCEYLGHEKFLHKIIIKYHNKGDETLYPIYPGKEENLKEILEDQIHDEQVYNLKKKIKELEDIIKKNGL